MKHLRWGAVGLCIVALAACDETPAGPDAGGTGPDGSTAVSTPVLGAVPVLNTADGHLYDAVAVPGLINWTDAKTAAEGMTSGACQGYLASITSAAEDSLILAEFQGGVPFTGGAGYWIGGFQDPGATPADADWMWVSGEAFSFSNWAAGQPDDGFGLLVEDAIRFVGTGGGFSPTVNWEDVAKTETAPGYVVEFDGVCTENALLEIMLQLTQGESPRIINLKSQGKIAAAVLSASGGGFDATTIDPTTVTLGNGSDPEANVAENPQGRPMVSWPDLDADGLQDALFHFNTQDLVAAGLTTATTELVLSGTTTDGTEFSGTDAVVVKQPK